MKNTSKAHPDFREAPNREGFLRHIKQYLPDSENPICVEIGVDNGNFSKLILDELTPKQLYLVDPWVNGSDKNAPSTHYSGSINHLTAYSTDSTLTRVKTRFDSNIKSNQVILKQGFSYDVVNDFPDNTFDFIYIDATHIYESVKADLNDYLSKLKPNGLMCGHDYQSHGGTFSVIPAVDEFVETENFKWLAKSPTSGHDWALIPG